MNRSAKLQLISLGLAVLANKRAKAKPTVIKGIDGRDGRDAPTKDEVVESLVPFIPEPIKGERGLDGKDAPQLEEVIDNLKRYIPAPVKGDKGRDAPTMDQILEEVKPLIPIPQDGRDGKDAPPLHVIVKHVLDKMPKPKDGKHGKNGKDGKDGKDGKAPAHQVQGTKIRFKQPNGVWGQWINMSGRDQVVKIIRTTETSDVTLTNQFPLIPDGEWNGLQTEWNNIAIWNDEHIWRTT